MSFEDDFLDLEKMNAINKAKDSIHLSCDYFFLEEPPPHCVIHHNSDRSISARVHILYKNRNTEFITKKIINLRFHDAGIRSFWSYVDSVNG